MISNAPLIQDSAPAITASQEYQLQQQFKSRTHTPLSPDDNATVTATTTAAAAATMAVETALPTMVPNKIIAKSIQSVANSTGAKEGLRAEKHLVQKLNHMDEPTRIQFLQWSLGVADKGSDSFVFCTNQNRSSKVDVYSSSMNGLRVQVKSHKYGGKPCEQQCARGSVDKFLIHHPLFKCHEKLIREWIEKPLEADGKTVQRVTSCKKLTTQDYDSNTVDEFISCVNDTKLSLVNFALLGTDNDQRPDFLVVVDRERLRVKWYHMSNVIQYICQFSFDTGPYKTRLCVRDHNNITVFAMQRKGGDGGKKSSNDIQFKINVLALTSLDTFEHSLV